MTAVRVICDTLLDAYGPRGWWPIVRVPGQRPTYQPNSWREERTPREIFQIGVGAVLTQRCAWRNTADVIGDLATIDALDPAGIARISDEELARRIRPCGTWRRKLATLRTWSDWFSGWNGDHGDVRERLLALPGFGPETADSISVYGLGERRFIADAYARRILARIEGHAVDNDYERVRHRVEAEWDLNPREANEIHALLVEVGKRHCRATPSCGGCPLYDHCATAHCPREDSNFHVRKDTRP